MENWISTLILAIVQGITEWIPVSSSGHLVLFERMIGFGSSVEFDVALHFGTLMAAFVYFGKDITDIIQDLLKGKFKSENGRLGVFLIIATIPAGLIGFFFKSFFESAFNSLGVVALGFGVTGLFLFIASLDIRKKAENTYFKSLLIGLAQAFSILPGVSRSGATISSGVLFGLGEKEAVKFSFLMSIPIIFGAAVFELGNKHLPHEMIFGAIVSFVVGLFTIYLLINYVLTSKRNLRWFGAYALLLSISIVLFIILSR